MHLYRNHYVFSFLLHLWISTYALAVYSPMSRWIQYWSSHSFVLPTQGWMLTLLCDGVFALINTECPATPCFSCHEIEFSKIIRSALTSHWWGIRVYFKQQPPGFVVNDIHPMPYPPDKHLVSYRVRIRVELICHKWQLWIAFSLTGSLYD